jgi:hypothetical protein
MFHVNIICPMDHPQRGKADGLTFDLPFPIKHLSYLLPIFLIQDYFFQISKLPTLFHLFQNVLIWPFVS